MVGLLSIRDLDRKSVESLLQESNEMKELVMKFGGDESCKHKIAGLYFCEPSTRTSCSFQAAMQRLGGSIISVNPDESSMKKGESTEDTVRTLASYCDILIIRHPHCGSIREASKSCLKPVINAGKLYMVLSLLYFDYVDTDLGRYCTA